MGMGSKKIAMQGTRPGARPEPEVFFTPFSLLPPVASPQHSITPLLHFSIHRKIPCNLSRHFPLYGVMAGGLPAKAVERKELNVNID